jgi:hypothetical protein
MSLPLINFDVSPSSRTSNPTNYPHELCLACSSPYHNAGDCPHWGQFTNFSCGQLNTNFSDQGFESHSNSYTPNRDNHYDVSWFALATGNYTPQVDELHHPEYPQFDNHVSSHSSYDYPPEKSSLEDTLKEFMELVGQSTIPASHEPSLEDTLETFRKTINQPCHGVIDATVANTEAIVRLEGQFGHLVAEFNKMEEEEFQGNEMAHLPQKSLVQHFPTAHVDDFEGRANQLMAARDAHTQLSHTHTLHQSCEYCYHPSHQFDDCPFINHYMTEINKSAHEHTQITTTLVSEERALDMEEEKEEQLEKIEPPPILILANDKEVSTEAHSFVTIPLETYHSPQVLPFQCLEEPSYVEIFKDSHTQGQKSRNCGPKKISQDKFLGYIRWWNILPEGYHSLKKKGWKGLVGHAYERGRCGMFFFFFSAL